MKVKKSKQNKVQLCQLRLFRMLKIILQKVSPTRKLPDKMSFVPISELTIIGFAPE